ncbi:MAG: LPP20 family lipoprotein [Ignavibacteriales bacterium]|nr:LPP20 family lipoprotein [Ignavibacteriales bacterium]
MKQFLLISLTTTCFLFAQEKPSWIDAPQDKYPSSHYLTAIGTGDTRKAAENSAAASLSQIFQSTIKAEQTVNERYKELFTAPNQSTFEGQSDVTKNITISTDQTLYNVQYGDSYTDNLGKIYVLASLERRPTAEIYKKKMEENETQMLRYIKQYDAPKDPVARYAGINAASVFSSMNEMLKSQLLIIMPGEAYAPTSGYDAVKVQQMLNGARKDLPFSIALTGDSDGRVVAIVKEMLSEMGFVTVEKGAISISGDVSFQELDLKRPEKYVRWSYKFSVVDPSGASIVSLNENGREGHVTYDEAVNRSLRTMKQKIKTNFGREINKYFDKMVKK